MDDDRKKVIWFQTDGQIIKEDGHTVTLYGEPAAAMRRCHVINFISNDNNNNDNDDDDNNNNNNICISWV